MHWSLWDWDEVVGEGLNNRQPSKMKNGKCKLLEEENGLVGFRTQQETSRKW